MAAHRLKSEARKLAATLGHDLARWRPNPRYPAVYFALCRDCFAAVVVDGQPRRPYLTITGEATRMACVVERQEAGPLP